VFPVFHENLFLSQRLKAAPGAHVLDIGFGSGIFSIKAALKGACRVYGTDINPKAQEYAIRNSIINGVEDKVHFYVGDTYEPLRDQSVPRFDLICTNPPFLPIPEGIPYYLHSNGGPHGTTVISKILRGVRDNILPQGCFQMVTMSLGDAGSETLVGKLLQDTFVGQSVAISVTQLKDPLPLSAYISNLRDRVIAGNFLDEHAFDQKMQPWETDCTTQGMTHLHYLFVEMHFGRSSSYRFGRDDSGVEDVRQTIRDDYGFPGGIQWDD